MKTIIFVLEVKESRGRGHWYRCLELTNQLRNKVIDVRIVWLIDCSNEFFSKQLEQSGICFKIGDYRKAEAVIEEIAIEDASLIILDLMELQEKYVLEIKKNIKVITIGGSGEGLIYSNISINGMFGRTGFIDKFYGERLYVGEEYIIFRSEIYGEYNKKKLDARIERVFISLGADYEGIGIELAKILKEEYPELEIDVLACTQKKWEDISGINIFNDIEKPWKLIKNADICISAGGMTAFEALYLGIPLILVPITQFQIHACIKFQDKGLGIYVGLYGLNIKNRLINKFRLIQDINVRRNIQTNRNSIFKKDSRNLVVEIIIKEL